MKLKEKAERAAVVYLMLLLACAAGLLYFWLMRPFEVDFFFIAAVLLAPLAPTAMVFFLDRSE